MTSFRRLRAGFASAVLVSAATVEAWAAAPPAAAFFTAPSPLHLLDGPSPPLQLLVPPVPRQPRVRKPRPVAVSKKPPPRAPESACADTDRGPQRGLRLVEGTLRRDQKPRALLRELGVSSKDIRRMTKDFKPWVRIGRLRVGHEVKAAFRKGRLVWIRHRVGIREAYCGRRNDQGRFSVLTDLLPMRTELQLVEGVLLGPWPESMVAAGERRALGLFAGSLFPASVLKSRAKKRSKAVKPPFRGSPARVPIFRLLVEKRFVEGRFLGYGAVPFIELDDGQRARRAVRFERGDGISGYYNEAGRPIAPRRLRAPVLDAYLTSGYGRRRHPILRRWRMHRGVDYGAPRGTAVFAVESGVVEHAGWRGPLGRLVTLAHADGLATRHAHLDRIASGLLIGDRVEAGDLIGYVGSTGLSTAPHLHFETLVGGKYRDPRKIRPKAPPPLTNEERERFLSAAANLRDRLFDPAS